MPLFVLDGYGGGPQTQALLFALFLVLYLVAVLGNITMIVVITLDARLHSPMYFFLKNLSFLDLCYSSVIYPKALFDLMSSTKVITFAGCVTQFFFFSTMITTEGFLLAVMAYDRFMAICSPLLPGASMRNSAHGKGHEEGGSAYAKAGSSLRSPPGNSRASTPKTRVCLLYCFVLSPTPLTLWGAVPHHHLSL